MISGGRQKTERRAAFLELGGVMTHCGKSEKGMLTRIVFTLAALMICTNTPAMAQNAARKLPTIPFEKYTLKNGLEVILSEDHTLPLVSVNL